MLNKKGKSLIAFLIIIIMWVSLYLIYNIIQVLKYGSSKSSNIVLVSDIKASNDYKVYLNENKFIEEEYLQNDSSYVSLLVKYIETAFKYEYKTDADINIKYNYELSANVVSRFISDNNIRINYPVWNKKIILNQLDTTTSNNGTFKINELINIDLGYYNGLVEEFKQELNIPIESNLDIKLVVKMEERTSSGFVNAKEHNMMMTIPLGVKSFDISKDRNFTDNEITYRNGTSTGETKYALAIVYIILMIIIIGSGTKLIFFIMSLNKNKYRIEIDKLLNNYNNRIVTVTNFLDYKKFEIVNLLNFEEMLNLADETFEPIMFWEKKINQEAWFSILRNNILYMYVISNK